jgi:hypothetical protein
VDDETTAGSAQNRTTGEDLSTDRSGLAIRWQTRRALELCEQVEKQ